MFITVRNYNLYSGKAILFLFFIQFSCVLCGQETIPVDTLGFTLKNDLNVEHRIELMTYQQQINRAANKIDKAIIHNKIADLFLKSSYYIQSPKYDSVIYHANKARLLVKNDTLIKAKKSYLLALGWLGTCYVDLGNKSKALSYFNDILTETENIKNPDLFYSYRQTATTETALIYAAQDNLALAIKQYKYLLDYVEKYQIDKKKISSIVYMKLAGFYRQQGNYTIAFEYASKALQVANFRKVLHRSAMSYLELAAIRLASEEFEDTEMFLSKAFYILSDKPEYTVLLSKYYGVKSSIAIKNGDIAKHVLFAEKAFELIKNKGFSKEQLVIGVLLYEAYKKAGDFEKALAVFEKATSLEKKMTDSKEIRKSSLLEIRRRDSEIAFEQSEKELERVKSQRKTAIILMTLLLLVIAIIATFFALKDRKKKIKLAVLVKEKNEQLEELDLAKSRFFTNISHELRTPLTLISSPLKHLLDIEEKDFRIQARDTLQLMGRNINKLQNMVNEILDLSKLESGRMKLEEQPVACNLFMNSVASNFESLDFKKLKIQYTYEIDLDTDMWSLMDANKVEKIISNLILNAFKNSKSGDQIALRVYLEDDLLIIEIKDTGNGIDPSDLPHIFNRFYQGKKRETTTLQEGTGIGLALSKELAIFMEGDLTVESQLGKGSTFSLHIPLKETEQRARSVWTISGKPDKTKAFVVNESVVNKVIDNDTTILIVEDQKDMRTFIKSLLQDKFQIYEAINGKEALIILENNTIDLVISDVMMPEMNGYEFLEKLKENDSYRSIPVIMLTALNKEVDKLQALTIGVDDYLTKPFSPKELIARINNLLLNKSYRKNWQEQNQIEDDKKDNDVINIVTHVSKIEIGWLQKVKDRVLRELENENFRLSILAKEMHLSERQFQRKIKKITGLSPKQFQQEIALQKARELLDNNVYANSTAVAYSVGIYNVTRFSKQYENRFGRNPSTYFEKSF